MPDTRPLRAILAVCVFILWPSIAMTQKPLQRTASRPDARVFFVNLRDGAHISSKFTVKFGVANVDIIPAGETKPNSGHHHLLIDSPLNAVDQPIPNDANHLHFGRGQTEAEIILSPGPHTLQLVLGDHDHTPHNPPVVSDVLRITVDPVSVEKARTPAPPNARVSFVGIEDGATIPARSIIRFAISGMELVPAGTVKPDSGHHHLIIDAPQPDLNREIPSDPNYVHFGRGQTEAEVTLTPGPHTLQLVLGDHEHVPHDPPIMSKPIRVTAVEGIGAARTPAAGQTRTAAPSDASVYFVYPPKGALIYPNSTIRFGLRNMGVAPAGIVKENTGHHHLLVNVPAPALDRPIPNDLNHLHFGAGQTERKITLKPGKHTLQLVFTDHQHVPFDPPVLSERIEVTVIPPRKRRRR